MWSKTLSSEPNPSRRLRVVSLTPHGGQELSQSSPPRSSKNKRGSEKVVRRRTHHSRTSVLEIEGSCSLRHAERKQTPGLEGSQGVSRGPGA